MPLAPPGVAEQGPHRDKNIRISPCCIARKLTKKEMSTDPRAKAALDAEWEKLCFLKRPHPIKGHGAWDEGNVREASAVRKEAQDKGRTFHVWKDCGAVPRERK